MSDFPPTHLGSLEFHQDGGYCVVCGTWPGGESSGPRLCGVCQRYRWMLAKCECCERWDWYWRITEACQWCGEPICKHCDGSGEHSEIHECYVDPIGDCEFDDDEDDDDEPEPSHKWPDECVEIGGLCIKKCQDHGCLAVKECTGCLNCGLIALPEWKVSGWELKQHPFLKMPE